MYRIEVLGDISQGLGNELDRIKVGTSGGELIGEVNAMYTSASAVRVTVLGLSSLLRIMSLVLLILAV